MCCARAIVTAKAIVDNDPQKNTVCKGDKRRGTLQKTRAQVLMHDAGLDRHVGPCNLRQLDQLQDALGDDYQLKVFGAEQMNSLIFKGNLTEY